MSTVDSTIEMQSLRNGDEETGQTVTRTQDKFSKFRAFVLCLIMVLMIVVVVLSMVATFGSGAAKTTETPVGSISPVNMGMSASELVTLCETSKMQARLLRNRLVNNNTAITKQLLVATANHIDVVIGNVNQLASLLAEVHPNAEMQETANQCALELSASATSLSLDREWYQAVVSVGNDRAADTLEERMYQNLLTQFRRSGVNLESAIDRQRVQNLTNEISQLSSDFSRALNEDTRAVIVEANEQTSLLDGLPSEFVESHRLANGSVRVTTDYPDYIPAMKFARNSEFRRRLFVAANSRGFPQNEETLRRVLQLRQQLANLLGSDSWAAYETETKMIKSPQHAAEFLQGVVNATRGKCEAEKAEMLRLKRAEYQANPSATGDPNTIEAYDVSRYTALVREANFSVDPLVVAKYFRFDNTREGILEFAENAFGLRFRALSVPVWHEDVFAYEVFWATDSALQTPIGRFYLDMFPRENKYKHAAQFPIRAGVSKLQIPEGALVCNFPKTGPMEHSQVTTFFHEFGHLMHHIVGGQDQPWAVFSGVATEWDFVEAPSQMLEEWAFNTATLQKFATDSTTGNPITDTLVQQLKKADTFPRNCWAMRQMFYATLSLELHGPQAPSNPGQQTLEIEDRVSPYPHVPDTHFEANFGHLMGYSAIYYTYMWSQAIARNMFVRFAGQNMMNGGVWLDYRDLVIRRGGQRPAASLVFDFIGHDFSLEPLQEWLSGN